MGFWSLLKNVTEEVAVYSVSPVCPKCSKKAIIYADKCEVYKGVSYHGYYKWCKECFIKEVERKAKASTVVSVLSGNGCKICGAPTAHSKYHSGNLSYCKYCYETHIRK